ncbi:S-layer homology domain-containing protein [Paenibacillus sp. GSMTC-2017]|uniref:S-layer homology domain-containing protein n=1 Tax=Paenibacillus sp. GSMTC-2017 TaxID=2794350 RepID=UPI0018D821AA|nr:S-layer homology domain-containing protein [Paenibacillus sp. GSMTC-2017]MBH5317522.1 S-layer homology domain-containing protein [Paenibacillus sp. GSMTC-2017]
MNTGKRARKKVMVVFLVMMMVVGNMTGLLATEEGKVNAAVGFNSGDGSVENPFIVSTAEQLDIVRNAVNKHYKLGNDIDLTTFFAVGGGGYNNGAFWRPIGTAGNPFKGSFDGAGFIINGLKINSSANDAGFFGVTSETALIKNIGLENVDIKAGMFVGGLVGSFRGNGSANKSSISSSYVTGKVSGSNYIGGLVGYQRDSIISNSYSSTNVTGSYVGGLVGYQDFSSIINSYATGLITGVPSGQNTGGLVGRGSSVDSFYDQSTTGQNDNSGKGTPKTTDQMKVQATFTNWDFTNVWYMFDGQYPQLQVFVMAQMPVADPDPADGPVVMGTSVTLSSKTVGASVYYTTNGDDPTTDSALFNSSSPVIVNDDVTIKAIAVFTDKMNSPIMVKNYTVIRADAPTTGMLEKGTAVGTTKLNGVTNVMEYTVNGGQYIAIENTVVDNISVKAGHKITIRIVAIGGKPASSGQELTVAETHIKLAEAPTSGSLTQGTNMGSTKIIGVTAVMQYKVNGGQFFAIADTTVDNIAVNVGDMIYVRIAATEQLPASNVQELTVDFGEIKQAGAPSGMLTPGSNSGTTQISNVTNAMEYKVNSGNYMAIGNTIVDSISVHVGDKIYIRIAGTSQQPASIVQELTVDLADIKQGAGPTSGSLTQGTNGGTTTLNGVTNEMEFKVNDSSYIAITDTTADNISVNIGDTIYVRFAATLQLPASVAQELMVSLADIKQGDTLTSGSLSKGTIEGTTTLNDVTDEMEYSLNNSTYIEIIGTSVEDIDVNAGDKIYVRVAETEQQPASDAQVITVRMADIKEQAAPTSGSLTKGTIEGTTTLKGVTDEMEYRVNSSDYIVIVGTSVDNIDVKVGDTISIRIVATELQPASLTQQLTVSQADFIARTTATLTSTIGIVSVGGTTTETITNISYTTTLTKFKAAITPAAYATFEVYDADGTTVATTLTTGKKVVVTAQDRVTKVTYVVTVAEAPASGGGEDVTTPVDTTVKSTNGKLNLPSDKAGEVSLDKDIIVTVPSNATEQELLLTITKVTDAQKLLENDDILVSTVYEILKNFSTNFKKPVTITIVFDATKMKSDEKPVIFYYDEVKKVWIEVAGGKISGNQITVSVDHFTKFAVFAVDQSPDVPVKEEPKPEPSNRLSDITGHWAETAINSAVDKGIVSGYENGTFKPNHAVTRAEFTVMLMNTLKLRGVTSEAGEGLTLQFTDEAKIGSWAKSAITWAVQAGYINGYADGTFRPDAAITRAEMAKMVAEALGLSLDANVITNFADDKEIPAWAKGAIVAVKENGYVEGKGSNKFIPYGNTTRAEAVSVFVKMLEQQNK